MEGCLSCRRRQISKMGIAIGFYMNWMSPAMGGPSAAEYVRVASVNCRHWRLPSLSIHQIYPVCDAKDRVLGRIPQSGLSFSYGVRTRFGICRARDLPTVKSADRSSQPGVRERVHAQKVEVAAAVGLQDLAPI